MPEWVRGGAGEGVGEAEREAKRVVERCKWKRGGLNVQDDNMAHGWKGLGFFGIWGRIVFRVHVGSFVSSEREFRPTGVLRS